MELSMFWIIVIFVVVFAVIISNIMLLKRSNKGFTFPENYEKNSHEKKSSNNDDNEPSNLV